MIFFMTVTNSTDPAASILLIEATESLAVAVEAVDVTE